MTELRFGRIVEIIREESSVKYKNDFFNYFIKELYVELGGNIDLFIYLFIYSLRCYRFLQGEVYE